MQVKTTKKLYKGKYQYNIVLVCAFSHVFRGTNSDTYFKRIDRESKSLKTSNTWRSLADIVYTKKIYNTLIAMDDYCTRVEFPTVTIYTNNYSDIIALRDIDVDTVRSINMPPANLKVGTVYMPTINYEFRVTIGRTEKQYLDFLEWADAINKLRITNGCREMLLQPASYGGGHFYVTGDNMLLMCRIQLAGVRLTVDRIVH
jgi:hypothetical protein